MSRRCTEPSVEVESLRFTEREKLLLLRSWNILKKDKTKLATRIFEMIFDQCPEAKQLFPHFDRKQMEGKNGGAKKLSDEYLYHSLRFLQVLESYMEVLDCPKEIEPLLANLGRVHAKYEDDSRGFRPCLWCVFKEATIFHFRRTLSNHARFTNKTAELSAVIQEGIDETVVLWRRILDDMVERMCRSRDENARLSPRFKTNNTCSWLPTRETQSLKHDHNIRKNRMRIRLASQSGSRDSPSSERLLSEGNVLRPVSWIRRRLSSASPGRKFSVF